MSDLTAVCLIGRLTKDAELGIAGKNRPYRAFSIATRRRSRQVDGEWTETPHYADFRLFGEKRRGIGERLKKGCLDRWERDGRKHNSLKIAAERIRIQGKAEHSGPGQDDVPDVTPPEGFETPKTEREGA
jgi:single-stranded DNA-binding protein